MHPDDHVCLCFHVSKRKIVNFVKQTRPVRASQVSQCFGAGSGCGWCIPFLVKIHARVMKGEAIEGDDITPEEYARLRSQYYKDVAAGGCAKNKYEADEKVAGLAGNASPAAVGALGAETGTGGSRAEPASVEAFDYTRYFSRSRPDPEPETVEDSGSPRRPSPPAERKRR